MHYLVQQLKARKASVAELEGAEAADQGFTLIELMVVLLIMGILLAIAIPTFLGARGSAQDRAAQSDLTNALTSAKAIYANTQSYPATTKILTALKASEPSLSYTSGTTTGGSQVSVAVAGTGQQLTLVAKSGDGICWGVRDSATGTKAGTKYAAWSKVACTAATIPPAVSWATKYPGTTASLPS